MSLVTPSRRARILICRTDSSPEIYSTRAPFCAKCSEACSSSVDLPMPGSPPTSISEPSTTPPPSTRSSSPMPVVARALVSSGISERRIALAPVPGRCLFALTGAACCAACGACSSKVFHALQPGICPSSVGFHSRMRCTRTPSFPSPCSSSVRIHMLIVSHLAVHAKRKRNFFRFAHFFG